MKSRRNLKALISLAVILPIIFGQVHWFFPSGLSGMQRSSVNLEDLFSRQDGIELSKMSDGDLSHEASQLDKLTLYAASGKTETIDIPRGVHTVSSFSVGGTTTVFFNDLRGGDKLDISLRNCTLLSREGYLKDGRIRVIVLTGTSLGNSMYDIEPANSLDPRFCSQELQKLDGRILSVYRTLSLFAAELPYEKISDLAEKSFVAHVFLDKKYTIQLAESVPIIKPPEKWQQIEMSFGFKINGSGRKIAILDTGIDKNHPDLDDLDDNASTYDPKVIAEACFTNEGHTWDGFGHGTHCASIAAGTGQASGYKYVGVAPTAFLLNGKVLDDSGSGWESWIINGIQWSVSNSANVISMSFGNDMNGDGTDPISMTVDWATMQGVVCAVAAGNNGYERAFTVGTPAVSKEAITVGATTKADEMAIFSSEGPTADYRLKPEVCAPGVDITAARANGTIMGTPLNAYYTTASGTSMATPHVAGASALILQTHPNWNPVMVKSALMGSAKMLGKKSLLRQGAGRIDVPAAVNTTVLTVKPSISFGSYAGHALNTTVTLMNNANTSASAKLSTMTLCDGNVTGYVSVNATSLVIPSHSNATVTLRIGPFDDQAPEGWYEGWLNISANGQFTKTPYLLAAMSTLTACVYAADRITTIDAGVVLSTYPDLNSINFQWTPFTDGIFKGAVFVARSGVYSIQAQSPWIYNGSWPADFSEMFMLQKTVSLPKFSVINVSIGLADASKISRIATTDSTGKNLTVHSYSQYFCGGPQAPTADPSFNSSQWVMGGQWSGYNLNISYLTLYSTRYAPQDRLCEALGYYGSEKLGSEVYLLPFKFWNVTTLPDIISYPANDLAKYSFFYDMPETYPDDGAKTMNAFWFTWDHMGSFQIWGWCIRNVAAGMNATYYLAPEIATFWGMYMLQYEGWQDPGWGPIEDWKIGRHHPYPQIPLRKNETGSITLGDFSFGPYQPGLKATVSKTGEDSLINLTGDIWTNLSWPHWNWYMLSPQQGPESPYPQHYAEYQVYVDGTLFDEGKLNGKKGFDGQPYVHVPEYGFLDVDWQGISQSLNLRGDSVLLKLILPSMATISENTVFNMSFNLKSSDSTPPVIMGLSHKLNFTPGENFAISFAASDVGSGIRSKLLKYSFDHGNTWKNATLQGSSYQIPCAEADSLAVIINVTDNAGNSIQYYSSPLALCSKVVLDVPPKTAASPGIPCNISGNLTSIEGSGIASIGVSVSDGKKTYAVTDENGSIEFTLMAPNATGDFTYRIVSPRVGVYSSQEKLTVLSTHLLPVAGFDIFPERPWATEQVTFNASNSYSIEGSITNYQWNFDDGNITIVTVSSVDHTFQLPGKYNVTLTVTDSISLVNSTTRRITVFFRTDFDKDGEVNIKDVVVVTSIYGSQAGDPTWKASADLDRNGRIDIVDVVAVAKDYGKTV